MLTFVFGCIFIAAGIAAIALRNNREFGHAIAMVAAGIGLILFGFGAVVWSTAIYVQDNQAGLVLRKFGADLPTDRIIATQGEKGPQAEVLPPGWHFGYWPWLFDLEPVDTIDIPGGNLGVITAKDGEQMPPDTVYAPEWKEDRMRNAQYFLTEGGGIRGPQLTVLKPGEYRYNPRLFKIEARPMLDVDVGEVAVIKADAGDDYRTPDGQEPITVNGTPIVPEGYRGIWKTAKTPKSYYLHPYAYKVTRVQTTNRVYEYAGPQAIAVRTRDGFEFPVDVRVTVKISAQNAPYVVAKLADPDRKDGKFTVLEQRVILPLIRAIFRNTAESRNALEFVNQRSDIEKLATEELRVGLEEFKVETDGVFVADIRIGDSEAGKRLLATQTDREVAEQEQATFAEKKKAQDARSEAVRAEEEANQQIEQAQARSRVIVAQEDAKALIAQAEGEAEAYRKKMEALGGVDNFVRLELARMALERWEGSVPRVFTLGDGAGADDPMTALIGVMLERLSQQQD